VTETIGNESVVNLSWFSGNSVSWMLYVACISGWRYGRNFLDTLYRKRQAFNLQV